jgi:hypothetical protein
VIRKSSVYQSQGNVVNGDSKVPGTLQICRSFEAVHEALCFGLCGIV